ncbi:hypothetical protein VTL71DRAFT_9238 [Oculimacula yallundae]|uniref:Cytochrome P450 n=1 Tax=Oculimacula yallundae TaxID=86028 RepID=A0ABR4BSG3_9HELO
MSAISEVTHIILSNRWIIVVFTCAAYAASSYIQYRRLKSFKGPWLAAWTDLWLAKSLFGMGPDHYLMLSNVCQDYGSVARIGPNMLVTTSPELLTRMSAARSPYVNWYQGVNMPPGIHNILSQCDEDKHSHRRKQMADGYAGKTNRSIEPNIDKHVQTLLALIRTKYISTSTSFKPIDMARRISFFTIDVITDIAFGQPFGDLASDTDKYDYISLTEELMPLMSRVTNIPLLRTMFMTTWGAKILFPSNPDKGPGKMAAITKDLVQKRFAKKEIDHQDMLSIIFSIIAGSDTTATAIRAIILYLATHGPVLIKLQAEIDDFVKSSTSTRDQSSVIKNSDAKELRFMQAVIREGLRMFPPAPSMVTKVAPPQGDIIELDIYGTGISERVTIPGGTLVSIALWGLQRNKRLFGDDAELFRPERWLIDDQEELARLERIVDLNFGHGKYQCPGKPIAWMELNKCIFELFRNFDFQVVDPTRPWKSRNSLLWMQSEMWLKVTERERH